MSSLTPLELQASIARQDDVGREELKRAGLINRKKDRDAEQVRSQAVQKASSVDETGEEEAVTALTEEAAIFAANERKRRAKETEEEAKQYYRDHGLGSNIDIFT
ncbi:MAG: hypothetical protein FWE37_06105 [Spirochaetaceae bacterium]|nr:hypothetical protein [Spirochaetaceae bacterium]